MAQNNEILEGVLNEFAKLAAIPRKSGHEQAVSDFLKKYLTELGFTVTQDEKNKNKWLLMNERDMLIMDLHGYFIPKRSQNRIGLITCQGYFVR